ncbi:MAG: hypothetical protein WD512_20190 [Candidatus Paceibacterota bacterium]
MREIKLKNKTEVVLYDDIDNLPIENYFKAKELWYIESQTAKDPADIVNKYAKLSEFLKKDLNKEARKELTLIINSHINHLNSIDHESLALACFIHSINGAKIDFTKSNEDLKKIVLNLSENGLTYEMVKTQIEDLKKKYMPNMS